MIQTNRRLASGEERVGRRVAGDVDYQARRLVGVADAKESSALARNGANEGPVTPRV